MQTSDLSNYSCTEEDAISVSFRDFTIKGAGPWCQGPVLLQSLNILEHFDLEAMGHNSGEYIHTITEALKIAFADREKFCGDPKFIPVPLSALLKISCHSFQYPLVGFKNKKPGKCIEISNLK